MKMTSPKPTPRRRSKRGDELVLTQQDIPDPIQEGDFHEEESHEERIPATEQESMEGFEVALASPIDPMSLPIDRAADLANLSPSRSEIRESTLPEGGGILLGGNTTLSALTQHTTCIIFACISSA